MNDYEARTQLLYQTAFQQGYTQGVCNLSKRGWQNFALGVVVGFIAYWAVGLSVIEFVYILFLLIGAP